jgi:hypothetical protein
MHFEQVVERLQNVRPAFEYLLAIAGPTRGNVLGNALASVGPEHTLRMWKMLLN